jgi:hypothetical protein
MWTDTNTDFWVGMKTAFCVINIYPVNVENMVIS